MTSPYEMGVFHPHQRPRGIVLPYADRGDRCLHTYTWQAEPFVKTVSASEEKEK